MVFCKIHRRLRLAGLQLQIGIDKSVDLTVHDFIHVARFKAGAVVLDQRVGHKDVRTDLRAPFDIGAIALDILDLVQALAQLDLHQLGFEHFERDVSVLRSAYRDFQFKFFKLDMLSLPSEEYSSRMLDFLDEVLSFGEDVSVELDVTADKRLGYLASAPYGTIFVENRYTAWANYYPHRTLRNLWSLSRFVPTSKLQFELVNPELYTDKYFDSDELRPALYGIDYLFASVMISNPLFWMETQFLSDGCRERLKAIVPIWKLYREELAECDVYPIGEEPSGRALTGFAADHGDTSHLLVFREVTDRDSFTFNLRDEYEGGELVVSDAPVDFELNGNTVKVKFENKRSYAWIKLRKK